MSKASQPRERKAKLPFANYFREVAIELQKVSWPSRQETLQMTVLVIVVSAIVALYLGSIDYLFTQLMSAIIK